MLALAFIPWMIASCGSSQSQEMALAKLGEAVRTPVVSTEDAEDRSRLVEQALDDETLMNLSRAEIEAALGRGDPCSRHPRCAENGFENDDWFYTVGEPGEAPAGPLPRLIVGFDHTGPSGAGMEPPHSLICLGVLHQDPHAPSGARRLSPKVHPH